MRLALDGRFIQDHFPGIGRYTYELARALLEIGEERGDRLALLTDPSAPRTQIDLSGIGDGARIFPVRAPVFSPASQLRLRALLDVRLADVYHSPYPFGALLGRLPLVVTIHDTTPLDRGVVGYSRRQALLFRLFARVAARRARRILVPTSWVADSVVRELGAPVRRIDVVPYGVGRQFGGATESDVEALRRRLALPEQFLLYVGINKPHKNLPRLIDAYDRAFAGDGHAPELAIVGPEDPRFPEARRAAAAVETTRRIRFVGRVAETDLPALYAAARGVVLPSLAEGFGLPVVEAMASGTPVACSSTGPLTEVAGGAALLFDPRDLEQIVAALRRLNADEGTRHRLIVGGRTRAAELTWRRCAERTREVYRRALPER